MIRGTAVLILGVVALLALLVSSCATKAVSRNQGKAGSPPAELSQQSREDKDEYDRLLALYLANAKHIRSSAESQARRRLAEDRRSPDAYSRTDTQIQGRQSAIINELVEEHKTIGRRLGGETSRRVYEVLSPTSDTSAEIFEILFRRDMVDKADILGCLEPESHLLTPRWISLVQRTAAGKADPSRGKYSAHVRAAMMLHSLGIDQSRYRPMIEQHVREYNDDTALNALFFRRDKVSGAPVAVRGAGNLALLTEMSRQSEHPMIRLTCANYAMEIGEVAKAEEICIALLSQRYKGFDDIDGPTPEPDYPLSVARGYAMSLLFERVCSEQGFKIAYDLSRDPKVEVQDGPHGWVRFSLYALGHMERDKARGLVERVREYAQVAE